MLAPPAPGSLQDSARTALLAAMLAVVVGVLLAWVHSARGARARPRQAPPPEAPPLPDEPSPPSQLAPYLGTVPARKSAGPAAIHLNSASYEELRQVDGIGPVQAARILAYRHAHGSFTSLDELRDLTGLAPERLEAPDGRRLVL
jgi:competence ComEA-like helix-hairpin-helix protein